MSITDRITHYIINNSSPTIRTRSESISVHHYELDESKNSALGKIKGTKIYSLGVYNIQEGNIKTNCSCPYRYDGLCKHEVSFLSLLQAYFGKLEEIHNSINTKEKPLIEDIEPIETVYACDLVELINKGIDSSKFLSLPWNLRPRRSHAILKYTRKDEFCIVINGNERNTIDHIKVISSNKTLDFSCSCNLKTNRDYCAHVYEVLKYVLEENPELINSHPLIQQHIDAEYEKYGFERNRENAMLFNIFWTINNGLHIQYKGKPIGLFDEENQSFIINSYNTNPIILNAKDSLYKNLLPHALPIKKTKSNKGFAFLFSFKDDWENNCFFGEIVKGNLLKSGTGFSGYVTKVDQQQLNSDLEAKADIKILGNKFLQLIYDVETNGVNLNNFNLLNDIWDSIDQYPIYHYNFNYSDRIHKRYLEEISIQKSPIELLVKVFEKNKFIHVEFYFEIDKELHKYNPESNCINGFYYDSNKLYKFKTINDFYAFENYSELNGVMISSTIKQEFINQIIHPLSKLTKVDIQFSKTKTKIYPYKEADLKVFISQYLDQVIITPKIFSTEATSFDLFEQNEQITSESITYKRNGKKEESFNNQFYLNNEDLKNKQIGHIIAIPFKEFLEDYKFLKIIKQWKNQSIEVYGLEDLEDFNYKTSYPSVSHNISSNTDWFDVQMEIKFDEEIVPLKTIKKAINKGESYVLLNDGSKGILPKEWLDKFSKIIRASKITKDKLEISKLRFSALDALFEDENPSTDILEYQNKVQNLLEDFKDLKIVKVPKKVKAKLRDYQQAGLNWLNFLDDFSIGGCLADDMGLGKTLQVIAFIQHLKEKNKLKKTHLVILPTSLVYNWVAELEKFCPTLKVLVHTGIKRVKETTDFNNYDIIITTYGLAVRDVSMLKDFEFDYIILDESQAIKNPSSQRYKAVRVLNSRNRLVLSGTPVENGLMDLFAQFSFINPGFLYTQTDFKENYINPIEKKGNADISKELTQLINPFLLRRTKEQVAKDLPEKTEQVLYCSMSSKQEQVYKKHFSNIRKSILEEVEEEGLNKSKLKVLAGLTKLRQLCNSPELVGDPEKESVKINELLMAVKEKTGNHKILIFSQFVKMLRLIEKQLISENIQYEYLDGQTKNRQDRVDRFQTDSKIRVFLISLKAGGTGLNLTAADYVYIVDPWWNPAVENQAIDRTYRIGQKKNVTAYRMICKDTIEEKIMALQDKKKKLTSDIIVTDENFVKQITKKDLEELFK